LFLTRIPKTNRQQEEAGALRQRKKGGKCETDFDAGE